MKYHTTFRGFFLKEVRQTLRDPRMRFFLFIVPLIQLTVFTLALNTEIRNIRLAAVIDPSDKVAQRVFERALATKYFLPSETTGTDPYAWVQNNQADAVIVTNARSLTASISRGDAQFQLLIDSKSVLKAQAVENYIKAILGQVLVENGLQPPQVIQFQVRALYNPTLETSVYMIPGLICMLVCIVTILLTSMSISKEREVGTLETLISAPVRSWEVLLGKTVPFIILGCIQLTLVTALAVSFFGVPLRGSIALLAVAAVVFVICTVSIGTLISTVARTQQQSMMGGFIFLFPGVLMSGLLFPIESMPPFLQGVAWVNPMAHFIALLRNLMVKGTSVDFFMLHITPLFGLAALCATIALKKFKTTL